MQLLNEKYVMYTITPQCFRKAQSILRKKSFRDNLSGKTLRIKCILNHFLRKICIGHSKQRISSQTATRWKGYLVDFPCWADILTELIIRNERRDTVLIHQRGNLCKSSHWTEEFLSQLRAVWQAFWTFSSKFHIVKLIS